MEPVFSSLMIDMEKDFVCLIVLSGWLFNRFWINRRFVIIDKSLHGKTILITGANQGIGYQTAKQLLKRGLPRVFSS